MPPQETAGPGPYPLVVSVYGGPHAQTCTAVRCADYTNPDRNAPLPHSQGEPRGGLALPTRHRLLRSLLRLRSVGILSSSGCMGRPRCRSVPQSWSATADMRAQYLRNSGFAVLKVGVVPHKGRSQKQSSPLNPPLLFPLAPRISGIRQPRFDAGHVSAAPKAFQASCTVLPTFFSLSQARLPAPQLDNRGSSRRGLGFEGTVSRRLGAVEVGDQAAGVAFAVARGVADPARVAIYGWSYGGYLARGPPPTTPRRVADHVTSFGRARCSCACDVCRA